MNQFTVKIKEFEYRDKIDPTIYRTDWCAVVSKGKQVVYQSVGYPFATEAMKAAEIWMGFQGT